MAVGSQAFSFEVRIEDGRSARFSSLTEARAMIRFVTERGQGAVLLVVGQDERRGRAVVYPLSHHQAEPRLKQGEVDAGARRTPHSPSSSSPSAG
ncbi:hypothetical protein [Chthonobacter albigriseus]|uniref:hypothetical protein n=1 Tax=Chthonobacter albigriseus TaxID=1683161 RepID=UPI0015EFD579|nr:hypothetical protein [Chthonobacter albigriseus]